MAKRVFKRINDAEERVHGSHTHFHEVGADDAIADVIGACTALYSLRVDGVAVMPIALGSGSITGSHGTFPVPAPATTEILRQSKLLIRDGKEEGGVMYPNRSRTPCRVLYGRSGRSRNIFGEESWIWCRYKKSS